jgi:hypothetical protein
VSIKLKEIYRIAVEKGIAEDARDRAEIDRVLAKAKKAYDKLDEDEREFFDTEKFTNPYADTRICAGDPDLEVRGLLVGIDMEVGEVLLADRLREKGEPIDLIFAHHPEGAGYAGLHEVMYMQADLWAAQGVGIGAADALIDPRAQEIRRKVMPANHYRAPDAAALLGLAMLSCHTPADNSVNAFVQRFLEEKSPATLEEVVKVLRTVPEYADAARKGYGPCTHLRLGVRSSRAHRRGHDRRDRGTGRGARPALGCGGGHARRHALLGGSPQEGRGTEAQPRDRRARVLRHARHEPRSR